MVAVLSACLTVSASPMHRMVRCPPPNLLSSLPSHLARLCSRLYGPQKRDWSLQRVVRRGGGDEADPEHVFLRWEGAVPHY